MYQKFDFGNVLPLAASADKEIEDALPEGAAPKAGRAALPEAVVPRLSIVRLPAEAEFLQASERPKGGALRFATGPARASFFAVPPAWRPDTAPQAHA
jgi:hypothetical protein